MKIVLSPADVETAIVEYVCSKGVTISDVDPNIKVVVAGSSPDEAMNIEVVLDAVEVIV